MRKNSHLIEKSELLETIVEKIETSYSEDISLLICYGSYITGDYGVTSDIDFFFVPKTRKAYTLGHQFILNDIGYDLWPVSWERLTDISQLEEKLASILMDGEVLFASSEQDLRRLDDLKNTLKRNLSNEAFVGRISMKYLDEAKALYFEMQVHERNMYFIDAVKIVESLLFAIAIVNGTYTKKGIKQIEAELNRFSTIPVRFLETFRKLIRASSKAEVQHLTNELIIETEELWNTRFNKDQQDRDPSDLAGFYEEFKSTYNKLLLACDEKNYEKAYYAGFMIDRETQSFLNDYALAGAFPDIISKVLSNDYEVIRDSCIEHERQLHKILDQNGIDINTYTDSTEFRQHFLKKTI
jgi:predicted nucleotidyltransferase